MESTPNNSVVEENHDDQTVYSPGSSVPEPALFLIVFVDGTVYQTNDSFVIVQVEDEIPSEIASSTESSTEETAYFYDTGPHEDHNYYSPSEVSNNPENNENQTENNRTERGDLFVLYIPFFFVPFLKGAALKLFHQLFWMFWMNSFKFDIL